MHNFDVVGYVDSDYGSDLDRRRFLVISSLLVWVLSLEKHPYNLLQLYILLKPSMWLQLEVLKKPFGYEVLLWSLVLHKVP